MFQTKFGKPAEWAMPPLRARSAFESVRNAPPPALIGDFAHAAYFGALHISELLAVIENPDPDLAVVTDIYIHSLHDLPYTLGDAMQVTRLALDDVLLVVARLGRQGMIRRQGKLTGDIPLRPFDRIELAPMQKADLAGFFARAYERGPAVLTEWINRR